MEKNYFERSFEICAGAPLECAVPEYRLKLVEANASLIETVTSAKESHGLSRADGLNSGEKRESHRRLPD